MLCAALVAVIVSAMTQSALLGLAAAVIVSMLIALILAYFIFNLKTHNVMSGLSINMLAKGVTVFLLFVVTGSKGTSTTLKSMTMPNWDIPIIKNIPILGEIVSGQNSMTYLAFVCTALMAFFLYHTRTGLRIRAVGENPNAADSVGVSVLKVRYTAFIISGALSGLAGAYLTMGYMNNFTANMTAGRGFIALAACSMGRTTPWGTCLAALLFGCADALANSLQTTSIPTQFVQMIPYVMTIIGITIFSIKAERDKKVKTE
jgi:simple sugar transport system permease protein